MGIEMGIPDFRIASHTSMLAPWAQLNGTGGTGQRDIDDDGQPPQLDHQAGLQISVGAEEEEVDVDGQLAPASEDSGSCLGPELDDNDEDPSVQPEQTADSNFEFFDEVPDLLGDGRVFFMPSAMTIAGLQHIVNNLSADTHKSLKFWEAFFSELKNLEAFQNVPDRVDRYLWTCLRGTRYQVFEHQFANCGQTLYEARWHEVMLFLKKVVKVLQTLILTFDRHKYASGVDTHGEQQTKQGNKGQKMEADRGFIVFSPATLEASLKSPSFVYYVHMALFVESIPSALARESELCPCHRLFTKHLDEYQRTKLFERHYGIGEGVCLMNGKVIPELVAGRLEEAVEEVYEMQEHKLRKVSYKGLPAPSAIQWTAILEDFSLAKLSILSQLLLKTDFLKRLPVLFCGLAHWDEEVARRIAVAIAEAFDKDPRQEVHHRVTWKLMQPGHVFHIQLRLFASGTPRGKLAHAYRLQVSIFRFPSAVETTIEEKHARVQRQLRAHHHGPLAHLWRIGCLCWERLLARGHIKTPELLAKFEQARHLQRLPALLGIDTHPTMQPLVKAKPSQMLRPMVNVFYRCDLASMFEDMQDAGRKHKASKRKSDIMEAKAVKKSKDPLNTISVMRHFMKEHFVKVARPQQIYTLPRNMFRPVSICNTLARPQTKSLKMEQENLDISAPDIDSDQPSNLVSFQIVSTSIGSKKTVPVAVGAGGKISRASFSVTIHKHLSVEADTLVCDLRPAAGDTDSHDVVHLIDGFEGD
jgi:hypothetical protein